MSNFSLTSAPAHPARAQVASLDSMQKDMLEALHDDQVKKQINDAKLRAVKQRVCCAAGELFWHELASV